MKTATFCSCCLLLCLMPLLVNGDAEADLTKVLDEFFHWNELQAPLYVSTQAGNRQYNDRLANLSLEVLDSKYVALQQFISTTSTIHRAQLTRRSQYVYDIFVDSLRTFVDNYVWKDYGPLNHLNFLDAFYLDPDIILDMVPLENKTDFDNYIARLQAMPTQIQQWMERMDKAIEVGTTFHNVSVAAVPEQIGQFINPPPEQCPFYRPFNDTLDTLDLSEQEKEDLRSRALGAVEGLFAALRDLKTYFENTYMAHTRQTYGVYGLPSGREYYRACLKWHLSVDMSPEDVHRTGLREVDRITQLMHKVMAKQGYNGTIRGYFSQLKANPQFQMNSVEEIIDGYKDLIFNRVNPKLPLLFKDIPPNRIQVKPLPYMGPSMYKDGSNDGSRPGTFYVSVGKPNESETFSMMSLTLHEASPGHHLQSVFQLNADIPKALMYRDNFYFFDVPYAFPFHTAVVEGWALYAEYLGEELGVYADDYEMMGRYGHEIFRACRLVIDTGLHYFGWDREKAIRYMRDRVPLKFVEMEIDRYLTWPGQACAYKIGELKIKELRQMASKTLGNRFDVREFHSRILSNGVMPLSVLETIVKDYIDDTKVHVPSGRAASLHSLSTPTVGLFVLVASRLFVFMQQ